MTDPILLVGLGVVSVCCTFLAGTAFEAEEDAWSAFFLVVGIGILIGLISVA